MEAGEAGLALQGATRSQGWTRSQAFEWTEEVATTGGHRLRSPPLPSASGERDCLQGGCPRSIVISLIRLDLSCSCLYSTTNRLGIFYNDLIDVRIRAISLAMADHGSRFIGGVLISRDIVLFPYQCRHDFLFNVLYS